MQTYAVVDCDFRFVKIGRTNDLESRLATLNTASPRPLVLMALFNGDIEQDMHRLLSAHRERLEWFRYNEETESAIIVRMTPTKEWAMARKQERRRRRKLGAPEQMGPVNVSSLSQGQRDHMSGVTPGADEFGATFGIPDDASLTAVVLRAQKHELLQTRRLLSECGRRVRAEMQAASQDFAPSQGRIARASFAWSIIKNWRRRVGMELGAIYMSGSAES